VHAYVPEVVRARLGAGQAEWLAELRPVTPLFLNLLDADLAAADQLDPLQLVMATVQPILQRSEGSLKQVVVDDKGLILIGVFGLRPWPMRTTRPGPSGPRSRCRRPYTNGVCGARLGWPPAGRFAERSAMSCIASTTSSAR
jgi:hypothetical protein